MMNPSLKIRAGSRGSPLALRQTQMFIDSLTQEHPDLEVEIRRITTSGDRIQDRFLSSVGGKGLFVKEIEEALQEGRIDFAVHSLKDVPAVLPRDLTLGCFPAREDPRDVLISRNGEDLLQLREGAILGTTSLRRRSQIKSIRPDVQFNILRGNIDTRIQKLEEGRYDAIVLAKAGMDRLGLDMKKASLLPIIPAPGQGTLAIEVRVGDEKILNRLAPLHHPLTAQEAQVERYLMEKLGGSCNLPLGVWARVDRDQIEVEAFVGKPDASKVIQIKKAGAVEQSHQVADQLVQELLDRGAKEIIESCSEGITQP